MIKDSICEYIGKNLTEKRQIHTEGVRKTAIKLAERYGADPEKAELAALFHDMCRNLPVEVSNYYVRHLQLPAKYLNNVNLAHGKIAVVLMKRDFGVEDEDLLNAVSYHTTGRPGMSLLEKIIYIADAIEPGRRYPGVEELRKAAAEDLDKACLLSLSNTIHYVRGENKFLDEDTVLAEEYFVTLIKKKEKSNDQ